MFTQCSRRLHVCRSVTHSLMSAGRARPSGAAGWSWGQHQPTSPTLKVLACQTAAGSVPPPIQQRFMEHVPGASSTVLGPRAPGERDRQEPCHGAHSEDAPQTDPRGRVVWSLMAETVGWRRPGVWGAGVGGTKGHQGRGHLSNHLKRPRTSQTHIPGRGGRFRVRSRWCGVGRGGDQETRGEAGAIEGSSRGGEWTDLFVTGAPG